MTHKEFELSNSGLPFSRRDFLGGCAAMSSASLLGTVLQLKLTNAAIAAAGDLSGYKAMVCMFHLGGNDSYNMLAPYEDSEYADYASIRGNLSLAKEDLLSISDKTGRKFGLHPGMPELQELYSTGKLGFVANVGSLIEPTDRDDYNNRNNLPLGLFSHADLIRHWQTNVPQSRFQLQGWGGRMADILTDSVNENEKISMNYSFSSGNVYTTGRNVIPYTISTSGAQTLSGYNANNTQDRMLTQITDGLLAQTYTDVLEKTHAKTRRDAIDAASEFNNAVNAVPLQTTFPNTSYGRQMQMVAKIIGARKTLKQNRQIFFVSRGGFDNHAGLLDAQAVTMPEISKALKAFHDATVELQVASDVVTFSSSDFSRTLATNGRGSDHAWGGNHFVMGGPVKADVHGEYPTSLALGNSLDVGRGRLIPTTSVDQYAAELALWFGVDNNSDLEAILPNIRNFYGAGSGSSPLGLFS